MEGRACISLVLSSDSFITVIRREFIYIYIFNQGMARKIPFSSGSSKLRAGNFFRHFFAPIDDFAVFNLSMFIL